MTIYSTHPTVSRIILILFRLTLKGFIMQFETITVTIDIDGKLITTKLDVNEEIISINGQDYVACRWPQKKTTFAIKEEALDAMTSASEEVKSELKRVWS